MTSLVIFINLLLTPPLTTDDIWDCYERSDGVEVCERTIEPCHYERDVPECTIKVVRP